MKTRANTVLLLLLIILVLVILPGMVPERDTGLKWKYIDYRDIKKIPVELLEIRDIKKRKQFLIDMLLPLILRSNEKVLVQRERLLEIKESMWLLTAKEKNTLEELAREYRVDCPDYDEMLSELLLRVDILPPSLVLSQAAIESGWGTSRFALDGNNLFGMRTLTGKGMVPRRQAQGMVFKVSVFEDLQSSIDYYLWNINTHPVYKNLREIRSGCTYPYDPAVIAGGLSNYSEIGVSYVNKVTGLIDYNGLQAYDLCRLR